jgi:hypothetical protein
MRHFRGKEEVSDPGINDEEGICVVGGRMGIVSSTQQLNLGGERPGRTTESPDPRAQDQLLFCRRKNPEKRDFLLALMLVMAWPSLRALLLSAQGRATVTSAHHLPVPLAKSIEDFTVNNKEKTLCVGVTSLH